MTSETRKRLLGTLFSVVLLLSGSAVGRALPTGTESEGCSAGTLVTCRADRTVDRPNRRLGLDLEVQSPGAGLLPGEGTAERSAALKGTLRLKKPAARVEVHVHLRIRSASATHTRPLPNPPSPTNPRRALLPTGKGTEASVMARLRASAQGCANNCRSSDYDPVVGTGPCGSQQQSNDLIGLSAYITRENGALIPASTIRYEITIEGTAKLGSFPYLEPAQPDTGTVSARADAVVESVRVRPVRDGALLPEFRPRQCIDFPAQLPHPIAMAGAGSDVVVAHGFLKRNGRLLTEFVVAAQRAGAAVGGSGAFAPGWYEVTTGVGCSVASRGALGPDDMTVSADGRTTTLKVPLVGYGRATIVFTKAEANQAFGAFEVTSGCGIGSWTTTWRMDGVLVQQHRARLTGAVGQYSITGRDQAFESPAFAFRAAGGAIVTCTDCHAST